jgi:hypothetical protein
LIFSLKRKKRKKFLEMNFMLNRAAIQWDTCGTRPGQF